MKLLDIISEDPIEKLDVLKQFAQDAPVPPKKPTAPPAPVVTPTAKFAKPTAKSKPATHVKLEPSGLGATIEQAAKNDGIEGAHLANFMAQSKVETAGFKSLVEWSSGKQYEGRKDLGNTQPGDGPRFKGRGFIHLTGRENYTKCNHDCGWENTKTDIVKNPDLVSTNLDIAVKSALWYWNTFIRPNYKATSIVAVSTRVNGTNPNGLKARIDAFKDYCSKLGIRIQNIVAPVRKATKHAELDPTTSDTQVASNDDNADVIQTDLAEDQTEQFCPDCGGSLSEEGRASRALCTSGRPDSALGASQLASCKSQGLRARDGEKSHLITHGARKVRITVGGKKIKGKRYGGPLPDYGTRKNQLEEELTVPWSSKDSAINDIQQALIDLGYKTVKVTGTLDNATRGALKDFQTNNGLQVSGTANVETITRLNKLIGVSSKVTPTPSPAPTTSTAPAQPKSADAKADEPAPKPAPAKSSKSSDPNIRPKINNDMSGYAERTKIIKYLSDKGVDFIHIQGIISNIAAESGFNSGAYVPHDTSAKVGTAAYYAAGPSGGLCQWHDSKDEKRFTKMMMACGGEGAWQTNWQGQLDFLLSEAPTLAYLKKKFPNEEEASKWWTINWEIPNHKEEKAVSRLGQLKRYFGLGKPKA